jgi:hypothetical protein
MDAELAPVLSGSESSSSTPPVRSRQQLSELERVLQRLEREQNYTRFKKLYKSYLQLLMETEREHLEAVHGLTNRAHRAWLRMHKRSGSFSSALQQQHERPSNEESDADEVTRTHTSLCTRAYLTAVLVFVQNVPLRNWAARAAAQTKKRSASGAGAESHKKSKQSDEAELQQQQQQQQHPMLTNVARSLLALEEELITGAAHRLSGSVDAVVPEGQKVQLPPLDRTKRTLYTPPSLGRLIYESRFVNPAARKRNLRDAHNPFPPLSMHCSMCREPLSAADENTSPERVPYIVCGTPHCDRWYHKRCVAKLHECFFLDGGAAEVDLMDTNTFTFLCPRCVFCHNPECKVAAAEGEQGAYSLKTADNDAFAWPAYQCCDICEALFHVTCALPIDNAYAYERCACCRNRLRRVDAARTKGKNPSATMDVVANPAPPGGAAASSAGAAVSSQ